VGPYFKAGFAPVKILAEDSFRRAWPGGVGCYKVREKERGGRRVGVSKCGEAVCRREGWAERDG